MAYEIEHKYLVKDNGYKALASNRSHILQGYLNRDPERTVRVRLRDEKGYITVKGRTEGDRRLEFEYEIPAGDARELLRLCAGPVLDKWRYLVPYEGHVWEVDEFTQGLVTAEIELPSSETAYSVPPFCGLNVTGDPRYYNSNIDKLLQSP